jgi:glycosyltransferase involved in cell wall biosynthesis/SAM-dependent methyltransferase
VEPSFPDTAFSSAEAGNEAARGAFSRSGPHISVVVACFDEEEALPALFAALGTLAAAAADRGLSIETVFVDDGSRDRTAEILAAHAAAAPGCRVVAHRENRGFGAAMRTGFAAARGRAVVAYDADATYPVTDVLLLAAALDTADVAGASPFAGGGSAEATPLRRALSTGAAALYRLALRGRGRGLTAFTCAFRAYRREVLGGLSFRADGFLAAAEVLALLLVAGTRYVELPSRLSVRLHGRSKMKALRVGLAHLRLLGEVWLRRGRFRPAPAPRPRRTRPVPVIADRAAWNAGLNRAHPMSRIETHANPLVRWAEERRRRGVLGLLGRSRGRRVLDVGAERGLVADRIRAAGGSPVLLDLDARVLAPGGGVVGDAERLPFAGRSFPRVLLSEVLEHCPDPEAAVREALRVTDPGGRVVLSVPDDGLVVGAKRLLARLGLGRLFRGLPAGSPPGHLHRFSRDTLRDLLSSAGRLRSLRRDLPAAAFLAVVSCQEGRPPFSPGVRSVEAHPVPHATCRRTSHLHFSESLS